MANVYLRFKSDTLKQGTEKAHLFVVDGKSIWLPKSQIFNFEDDGETVAVTLADWLVREKQLQEFVDPAWIANGCPS